MLLARVQVDQSPKANQSNTTRPEKAFQVNVSCWPVYLGELFISEQEGTSSKQELLHQSQFKRLWSSHCSYMLQLFGDCMIQSPQYVHITRVHWLINHDRWYQDIQLKLHQLTAGNQVYTHHVVGFQIDQFRVCVIL